MTDILQPYGDPTHAEFWDAARRHELIVQRCTRCHHHQFYARPFCLRCQSKGLEWTQVTGRGRIYSATVVRRGSIADLDGPYVVALIELQEGPRLLSNVDDLSAKIGDAVELVWRDRSPMPPLPMFKRT